MATREEGDICNRKIFRKDGGHGHYERCGGVIGQVSRGDSSWRRPGQSETFLGCTKCWHSYETTKRPGSDARTYRVRMEVFLDVEAYNEEDATSIARQWVGDRDVVADVSIGEVSVEG